MAEPDYNYYSSPNTHPFSSESRETDLVLLVEDKKLYVSPVVMSLVSPVFKTMLEGDYKEKHSSEIPLPEKKFEGVLQFLLCIYPSTNKPVTRSNLDYVLPLAEEYCVDSLKGRCEAFILSQFQDSDARISTKELVHFTLFGDMYKFETCVKECVGKLMYRRYVGIYERYCSIFGISEVEEFKFLSTDVKFQILEKRLRLMEVPCQDVMTSTQYTEVEESKKGIIKPSCSGCVNPDKGHSQGISCRIRASTIYGDILESISKLRKCFQQG